MADLQVKSGNLLPTYQENELYGVKFTILSDGKVCANGTPTREFTFGNGIPANISGDYYFSGCPSGGSYSSYDVFMYDKTVAARPMMWDGTTASLSDFGDSANNQVKIVAGHETEFRIRVRQGYELKNVIFSPYLREPTSPPYYMPYSSTGWLHSLRKLTTATEAVENPLYSDGTAITAYTLKGNTVQNGTPTPANPVDVQGVGERTDNLYPFPYTSNLGLTGSGQNRTVNTMSYQGSSIVKLEPNTTYYMSGDRSASQDVNGVIAIFDELPTVGSVSTHFYYYNSTIQGGVEFTTDATETYGLVVQRSSADYTTDYHMMLNTGSTAKTYEPHGYKIPISNGQQTIDIYIGDLPLLKSLDGTAVDEINNGTLTRRVDSDGSVLPTPTTTQITMPSIPTTEGANSITVDTTVQPSEFTATWTGWHNSSVKEWDGSQWNE